MALPYDPQQIEPRWQEFWARERFAAVDTAGAKDLYMLMMFPYPSGTSTSARAQLHPGDCLFACF